MLNLQTMPENVTFLSKIKIMPNSECLGHEELQNASRYI